MTRILIADDHDVVRLGLRTILEAHPNWEVVGEAADGKEAISKAIETQPDVAVRRLLVTARQRHRGNTSNSCTTTEDRSSHLYDA